MSCNQNQSQFIKGSSCKNIKGSSFIFIIVFTFITSSGHFIAAFWESAFTINVLIFRGAIQARVDNKLSIATKWVTCLHSRPRTDSLQLAGIHKHQSVAAGHHTGHGCHPQCWPGHQAPQAWAAPWKFPVTGCTAAGWKLQAVAPLILGEQIAEWFRN